MAVTKRGKLKRGQKIIIGVVCFVLIMGLISRLWWAGTKATRSIWRSAGKTEQHRITKKGVTTKPTVPGKTGDAPEQKETDSPNNSAGVNSEQESSTSIEAPETSPANPTTSAPKGLIVVDSPENGQVIIGTSFVLSGKANVFQNTLFYEVEDTNGKQWIAGATHVDGKWGGFSLIIDPTNLGSQSLKEGGPRRLTVKIHSDLSQQPEQATLTVTIVP